MSGLGTIPEWGALAPAGLLLLTAFVLLVVDAIEPEGETDGLLAGIAGTGAFLSLAVTLWYLVAGTGQPRSGEPLDAGAITLFDEQVVVDGLTLFFTVIITSVVLLVVIASYDYLKDHAYQGEYYTLVFLAATGMAMIAAANSFAVAFIAIELSSLPSYALVASLKHNRGSVEAGLKYFLVGALSSAILVYGISLVYGATGSLQFDAVSTAIVDDLLTGSSGMLGLGILMILAGFGFKIAAVPFHFWAPEAYEGAPAPISAFISSASKAAGFVITFRVFLEVFPQLAGGFEGDLDVLVVFQVLAIVTMTVANFAALKQEKVKRMLAYSSIGHAGYVLIALAALTGGADKAFVLGSGFAHLMVYGFMNTGAFLVIALAEYWDLGRRIEDWNGLASQAPFACLAMTIFLYSLAGLPLGGGFLSKFYLLWASVQGGVPLLAIALVVNSAVSLFYYTRVVKAMWVGEADDDFEITDYPMGLYAAITIAMLMTVLLLPGFGTVVEFAGTAAEMIAPPA